MARRGMLGTAVPRLKQYMEEKDELLTAGEVAEFLGVSGSTAYGVLLYMEAMDMVDHVKRGRTNLYFLRGAFDESLLGAMIPRERAPRRPKQARHAAHVKQKAISTSEQHMVEPHKGAPRDMLPALAILGIHQTESSRPQEQPQQSKPAECTKKRAGTHLLIKVERHGRVRSLPKEARHLSISDTTYLKKRYLSGLDGYENIERFDCFFSEAPALRRGEYGNVFYASMGPNPWEKVYKVTVERAGDG